MVGFHAIHKIHQNCSPFFRARWVNRWTNINLLPKPTTKFLRWRGHVAGRWPRREGLLGRVAHRARELRGPDARAPGAAELWTLRCLGQRERGRADVTRPWPRPSYGMLMAKAIIWYLDWENFGIFMDYMWICNRKHDIWACLRLGYISQMGKRTTIYWN